MLWDRGIFPLWVVIILVARDLVLAILNIALKRNRLPLLVVNYIGKAATFNLLYAFPMLFLSQHSGALGELGFIFGWAFSIWGITLYLFTGLGYLVSGIKSIRFPSNIIS